MCPGMFSAPTTTSRLLPHIDLGDGKNAPVEPWQRLFPDLVPQTSSFEFQVLALDGNLLRPIDAGRTHITGLIFLLPPI